MYIPLIDVRTSESKDRITQKGKAKELVEQFFTHALSFDSPTQSPEQRWDRAKTCAHIAVNELINSFRSIYDDCISYGDYECKLGMRDFWEGVKEEIENI